MLNLIKNVTEESLSDYNDNKIFLTNLHIAFEKVKVEIDENEFALKNVQKSGTTYSGRGRPKPIKQLEKTKYFIPEFEIPPTLSLEEEEAEEEPEEEAEEEKS